MRFLCIAALLLMLAPSASAYCAAAPCGTQGELLEQGTQGGYRQGGATRGAPGYYEWVDSFTRAAVRTPCADEGPMERCDWKSPNATWRTAGSVALFAPLSNATSVLYAQPGVASLAQYSGISLFSLSDLRLGGPAIRGDMGYDANSCFYGFHFEGDTTISLRACTGSTCTILKSFTVAGGDFATPVVGDGLGISSDGGRDDTVKLTAWHFDGADAPVAFANWATDPSQVSYEICTAGCDDTWDTAPSSACIANGRHVGVFDNFAFTAIRFDNWRGGSIP